MDAKSLLYDCLYVVLMKRWGADESHHYIMGVFESLDEAKRVAEEEREYRGGKYEWVIEAYSLNKSRRNCPMGKKIFRVARSEEMAILTDEESKIALSGEEITKEFKKHYAKYNEKKMKEELTQAHEMLDELRKENIELRQKLNGQK